ncbi:MAG: FAD-binding protein [Actinomycetota bacterium]
MGLNLDQFAREVGPADAGPVWVQGRGTRRRAPDGLRVVEAPGGITSLRADEMVVECGAGTTVDELQTSLAEVGQYANLPSNGGGTVGGALATGVSDIRRLGRGAARDSVLRVRFVGHDGEVVTAGGSTVKNVSGFDLCRLLVGSWGTLGFLGEILLRTRPLPRCSAWFSLRADVAEIRRLRARLQRPAALLWNGEEARLCLEGHRDDVAVAVSDLRRHLGSTLLESAPPDLANFPHRWSMPPRSIEESVVAGMCWAEVGVGTVHHRLPAPVGESSPAIREIERRLLSAFDPTGRLNPGVRDAQGASSDH